MTTATSPYLNKSHRELYPEQYRHELVGHYVTVKIDGDTMAEGIVERVVCSARFGLLAHLEDGDGTFWAIKDCHLTHGAPQ